MPPDQPGLDDAGRTWQMLTERLDAFVSAWDEGQPPDLTAFLPAESSSVRRLVLVELVKVDLDYRWQHQQAPRHVEDYLQQFPELASRGAPCDLIYEEFHIRKRAGEAVEPSEFYRRFPRQAEELARLFGDADAMLSTAAVNCQPCWDGIEPGRQIDDFDLLTWLGQGAFGRVFLARQRSMQRLVALKVSAARGTEPQTLAQLEHPNIVRVYDQRLLPDAGLCLLYMQYVPGGTLQAVLERVRKTPAAHRSGRTLLEAVDESLERHGEAPPTESAQRRRLAEMSWPEVVCWLGARLASALDHAHRRGVLHRDLKPANVLLTAEGLPRLADFNVGFSSKLEGATPAAFFGGTLAYMSPEQLEAFSPAHPRRPDSLDGRSDLYSLGVLLWELLTGRRPFPDVPLPEDWSEMLEGLITRRRAGITPAEVAAGQQGPAGVKALDEVLQTCLAPDPKHRFASGAELAAELELCLRPEAQALLTPPRGGWRQAVRRFPLVCLLLAGLVPNLITAYFNFAYNAGEIVAYLEDSEEAFMVAQAAVNGTAFPVGIGLFLWLARSVARGVRQLDTGQPLLPDDVRRLRRHCLRLGHLVAGISVAGWLSAAIAYPLSIHAALGDLPAWVFVHFMASLALCGLMAAVYPFFGVTFLCVRVLYPALMRAGPLNARDISDLGRLGRWTWVYLFLAASVPLLALTVLAVLRAGNPLILGVLGAGGLVGFGLAFLLVRAIQADLEALTIAAHLLRGTPDGAGDAFQSSWQPLGGKPQGHGQFENRR